MEKSKLSLKELINVCYILSLSSLSKCRNGKVAAGLFSKDFNQIFAIGINGGPKGQQDCLCDTGKYGCIHAEQNCLVKNRDNTTPKILICSKQPCQTCAGLIVNADISIKEVWYIDSYHDATGINILQEAGIKVYHVSAETLKTLSSNYLII